MFLSRVPAAVESRTTRNWRQNLPRQRGAFRHACDLPDVLLSFAGQARGVVIKGIDPERERKSDEALQRIVAGKLDFSPDADGIDALLIGKQLAEEWKVSPGDYVTLTSPQDD